MRQLNEHVQRWWSVYFTASFRPFPALNTGTFLAAILMTAPVWGFLPVRAFLLLTPNVPNPTSVTASPFYKRFLNCRQCCVYCQLRFFLAARIADRKRVTLDGRVRPHPFVPLRHELHGEARKRDAFQFSSPSFAGVNRQRSRDGARGHHLVRLQRLVLRLLREYGNQMRDGVKVRCRCHIYYSGRPNNY